METTIIERLPVHRLSEAQAALTKIHDRMVKAATRTGQVAGDAPSLTVVKSYSTVTCTECGTVGAAGEDCARTGCEGVYWTRSYCDVEVTMERPCLAGWEFLAVIEPLDGGNLIRQVPGANVSGISFDRWRSGALKCVHCNTVRRRTETFLVRGTGDTVKQVGRNCLADFLGGQSPSSIIARLAYVKTIRDMAGESYGGGGGMEAKEPIEFMSWVLSTIRAKGWISKGSARTYCEAGGYKQATADTVWSLLDTPPRDAYARAVWRRLRDECTPAAADQAQAATVLTWAQNITGGSDYEQSLKLVVNQLGVEHKHAGIFASAAAAYEREQGRQLRQVREQTLSTHQGTVGERVTLELTVERVTDFDTQYGSMHMHLMRDAGGNVFIWKTGSHRIEPGKSVKGKCTVKEHGEYNKVAQTVLSRCTLEVK